MESLVVYSTVYARWIVSKYTFGYAGKEETFTAPVSGTYKLEVWGSQGGDTIDGAGRGGYGAYATGEISLTSSKKLYINVGGKPSDVSGGYNGGGNGSTVSSSTSRLGGGGATHIALRSGLLKNLSGYKGDILIVGGAGGGGKSNSESQRVLDDPSAFPDYSATVKTNDHIGGDAGGIKGGDGGESYISAGKGATQTSGGAGGNTDSPNNFASSTYTGGSGSFGRGGNAAEHAAGGGAGWYGGGGGTRCVIDGAGGGGSSYIGNSLLSNKLMYAYNAVTSSATDTKTYSTTNVSSSPVSNYAKSGAGYAIITLLSVD